MAVTPTFTLFAQTQDETFPALARAIRGACDAIVKDYKFEVVDADAVKEQLQADGIVGIPALRYRDARERETIIFRCTNPERVLMSLINFQKRK